MITTKQTLCTVQDIYDIVDKDTLYVVETYSEPVCYIEESEIEDLKKDCFCDSYLSAKNFIKDYSEKNNKEYFITRKLEIKETVIQNVN